MFKKDNKKKQYTKEDMMFLNAVQGLKVPILTLDPNWHALFVNGNKPFEIKALEKKLTSLLKEEARLTGDNKSMQAQKKILMGQIIHKMSNSDDASEKKRQQQRVMIEEINSHVMENEDELNLLPRQIQRVNEELLLETFRVVYNQIDDNRKRIGELDTYINSIRQELTAKLLEKQSCETYNQEIFGNLNQIIGKNAVSLYDDTHPMKKD